MSGEWLTVAIDFKSVHFSKVFILHAMFFYVRYAACYRDSEEIMVERGVSVDHATPRRTAGE
jgi:putative transposase